MKEYFNKERVYVTLSCLVILAIIIAVPAINGKTVNTETKPVVEKIDMGWCYEDRVFLNQYTEDQFTTTVSVAVATLSCRGYFTVDELWMYQDEIYGICHANDTNIKYLVISMDRELSITQLNDSEGNPLLYDNVVGGNE